MGREHKGPARRRASALINVVSLESSMLWFVYTLPVWT